MRPLTTNDVMQLEQIAFTVALICIVADKLTKMEFNLVRIFISPFQYVIRGLFFGDWNPVYLRPINWFIENITYLFYILIVTGYTFMLFGLLEQIRLNQVQEKSITWFVGSPMVALGIIGIVCFNDIRKVSVSKIFSMFRHH